MWINTIVHIWSSIWFTLIGSITSIANYDDAHDGAPLARAVVTWPGHLAHDVGAKRPEVRRCGKLCGSLCGRSLSRKSMLDFQNYNPNGNENV